MQLPRTYDLAWKPNHVSPKHSKKLFVINGNVQQRLNEDKGNLICIVNYVINFQHQRWVIESVVSWFEILQAA